MTAPAPTATPLIAEITGLSVEQIVQFARLYGDVRRSFLRVGYGFSRQRNGAAAMHAVCCIPAITGSWRHRGGGAFFINWERSNWGFDPTLAHALDKLDPGFVYEFDLAPLRSRDREELLHRHAYYTVNEIPAR